MKDELGEGSLLAINFHVVSRITIVTEQKQNNDKLFEALDKWEIFPADILLVCLPALATYSPHSVWIKSHVVLLFGVIAKVYSVNIDLMGI